MARAEVASLIGQSPSAGAGYIPENARVSAAAAVDESPRVGALRVRPLLSVTN